MKRLRYIIFVLFFTGIAYLSPLSASSAIRESMSLSNDHASHIMTRNKKLETAIWVIGAFAFVSLALGTLILIARNEISKDRKELSTLNDKLKDVNAQLSETNDMREKYTSLFMDLCATYIDKLNRFPMILKMKVKNISDLNSVADKYVRPGESEVKEMFFNFDSAFLRIYPDFIAKFNALLKPDKQILPSKGELLCTDLRIYALVRMGIEDSNKIASLLFLSPQTIFNHRTQVRNRAIDRSTFEASVANLCTIIK